MNSEPGRGHKPHECVELFGENLRVVRRKLGITQEQLAQDAGVLPSEISRIENGRVVGLRLSTAVRIYLALSLTQGWSENSNVTLDELCLSELKESDV